MSDGSQSQWKLTRQHDPQKKRHQEGVELGGLDKWVTLRYLDCLRAAQTAHGKLTSMGWLDQLEAAQVA